MPLFSKPRKSPSTWLYPTSVVLYVSAVFISWGEDPGSYRANVLPAAMVPLSFGLAILSALWTIAADVAARRFGRIVLTVALVVLFTIGLFLPLWHRHSGWLGSHCHTFDIWTDHIH